MVASDTYADHVKLIRKFTRKNRANLNSVCENENEIRKKRSIAVYCVKVLS